jgi:hypothetical protein
MEWKSEKRKMRKERYSFHSVLFKKKMHSGMCVCWVDAWSFYLVGGRERFMCIYLSTTL